MRTALRSVRIFPAYLGIAQIETAGLGQLHGDMVRQMQSSYFQNWLKKNGNSQIVCNTLITLDRKIDSK